MKEVDPRNFMPLFTDQCLRNFDTLIQSVKKENEHQLRLWGVQTRTLPEWLTFTVEEVGEVAKAICEHLYRGGSRQDIYDEAIQTATLFLKIAELMLYD